MLNRSDQVWEELNERFGFPITDKAGQSNWKKWFKDYCAKQPPTINVATGFMHFGSMYINPILNSILMRRDQHPTFQKLVEYVILKGTAGTKR